MDHWMGFLLKGGQHRTQICLSMLADGVNPSSANLTGEVRQYFDLKPQKKWEKELCYQRHEKWAPRHCGKKKEASVLILDVDEGERRMAGDLKEAKLAGGNWTFKVLARSKDFHLIQWPFPNFTLSTRWKFEGGGMFGPVVVILWDMIRDWVD